MAANQITTPVPLGNGPAYCWIDYEYTYEHSIGRFVVLQADARASIRIYSRSDWSIDGLWLAGVEMVDGNPIFEWMEISPTDPLYTVIREWCEEQRSEAIAKAVSAHYAEAA